MPITYLAGSAVYPTVDGSKVIAHVVNNAGGWGAGFVVAISNRWKEPEWAYRAWAREGEHPDVLGKTKAFELGNVQIVQVEPDTWVANMLAQKGYGPSGREPHRTDDEPIIPLQYDELGICLLRVSSVAERLGASIHMPRIGCALAGGSWGRVEPLIKKMLDGQRVYVYDFPGGRFNP